MENLKAIIKKDPIIHTFLASELISNPSRVKQIYSFHADTHMSLAESSLYYERAIKCLTQNKSTFVGGVTGDYGLGKTSLLVYFWRRMQRDNILAIPPYCWEKFDENFRAVNAWLKFQLNESHPNLIDAVNHIYEQYTEPSLSSEAEKMVKSTNASYQDSLDYLTVLFNNGKLNLNLTTEDFLNYIHDITYLLVEKEKIFSGVMVFFDELQRSIEKNTVNTVAGILFDLASSLNERDGNYGIMMGMPLQIQASLAVERSDIFDRLEKFKCYITLEDLYGPSFAKDLWANYAEKFSFDGDSIVEPLVLDSLGQITNSKRKDLGNGPRSVISAFNRFVEIYTKTSERYNLKQFMQDLLTKEITLGERSVFVRKVNDLLSKHYCNNHDIAEAIKVLACFPDGCPLEVLRAKKVEKGLALLEQQAFGDIIRDLPNENYVLVPLQERTAQQSQTAIEHRLIQFRNRYAPDKNHATMAFRAFMRFIVPKLLEGWEISRQLGPLSCIIIGDTKNHPQRKLKLNIVEDIENVSASKFEDEHFEMNFMLNYIVDSSFQNKFIVEDNFRVTFNIDLMKQDKEVKIPVVHADIVPKKLLSPLFLLSFMCFIKDNEHVIPQAEKAQLEHLLDYLSDDLASLLVNSKIIAWEHNSPYHLNNAGKYLIQELLNEMAKKCYPHYHPLRISPQWESRLNSYLSLLNSEHISLKQKQSLDYLVSEESSKQAKRCLASLLGQSPTTVESYMQNFNTLFDAKEFNLGRVKLKLHPVEAEIVDLLKESRNYTIIKGKRLSYVAIDDLMRKFISKGYLKEEINFIVRKLGVARKLFQVEEVNRVEVIFQKSVSVEDYSQQLSEELKEAKIICEQLQAIEYFVNPIDLHALEEKIMQIDSEVEIDDVMRQMNKFKEYSKTVFDKYIGTIKEDIKKILDFNQYVKKTLSSHRAQIMRKVDSNVSWASVLFKIQTVSLLDDFKVIEESSKIIDSDAANLEKKVAKACQEFLYNELSSIKGELSSLQLKSEKIKNAYSNLEKNINYLVRWHKLAIEGFRIFLKARDIGSKSQYQKIESLEEEISMYLKQQRKGGLPNIEVFENKYESVKEEIQEYYISARRRFMEIKEDLIKKVTPFRNPEYLPRAMFSEAEAQASYQGLTELLREEIGCLIDSLRTDIKNLGEDLTYLFNVSKEHLSFNWSTIENLSAAIDSLDKMGQRINTIEISSQYDFGDRILTEILSDYKALREEYQRILTAYRESRSVRPELSNLEREIIQHIDPEGINLKGLFINLNAKNRQITIDNLFDALQGLFEKTQIMITIKRG